PTLKENHGRSIITSLFTSNTSQLDSGLVASYNISMLIVKCGMPLTLGQKLVLPAIKEVISSVTERDPTPALKSIPLSNDTVPHRINEMDTDTEEQLCLDETTTSDNNALLMAYVCCKTFDGQEMDEEFLFSKYLETETKGQTIFNVLHANLQKSIPEQVPHVLTIHGVLHHHNLVAKSKNLPFPKSLNVAVKAINKIKAHALNDRLFRQLCQEIDETFEPLLLHAELHWLSKGNCFAHFCELFDSIVEFLEEVDAALGEKVSSSRCDIMYLADFFDRMNEVTLKPQGKGVTLVQCKAVILTYLKSAHRTLCSFYSMQVSEALADEGLLVYIDHLRMVKADMGICFRDLLDLDIPIWVVQPFQVEVTQCEPAIQEHLFDIQSDDEAKAIFRTSGWGGMWAKYAKRYPALWEKMRLLLLAFPASYLVEPGFSHVLHMQSTYRNGLDLMASGTLHL
uniref:HAT C-terminal dimerisation domain-containing protein n=1 Tax=Mola mola TaxID=94237 RepID=A0A3Q3VYA2_MOLML